MKIKDNVIIFMAKRSGNRRVLEGREKRPNKGIEK